MASRLADVRDQLDHPPGVVLGILRLPLLDGVLSEMEALSAIDEPLVAEIERTVDLMTGAWIGAAPETQGRRVRLVELLRRADGGRLPVRAFDGGDQFGAEMRAILATDADLRETLGSLFPLAIRATSVAPSATWLKAARASLAAGKPAAEPAASAIRRAMSALVRADIVSDPIQLLGGVRLTNQRLARGLLWLAPIVMESSADLLGTVGLRMGMSGRKDAVVRDAALANTCAALLGHAADPAAARALASMRARVINRNVLKHVDRALELVADRADLTPDELVFLSLPTFELDATRRYMTTVAGFTATIQLHDDGSVAVTWGSPDGAQSDAPPPAVSSRNPSEIVAVAARATEIEVALMEERKRMEVLLASSRSWPEATWRTRFIDHPIGRFFGERLIWFMESEETTSVALVPLDGGWLTADGLAWDGGTGPADLIRLWHPADATDDERAQWRRLLDSRSIEQPIRQVDRETFAPLPRDHGLAADRRFAGRIVDHGRLRALLRDRGWAAPFVGSWDQGEEATAWRDFDEGLRAELLYQAIERLPTGQRHHHVRIIAVRFVHDETSVALERVPARILSEALRDVSLVADGARQAPD